MGCNSSVSTAVPVPVIKGFSVWSQPASGPPTGRLTIQHPALGEYTTTLALALALAGCQCKWVHSDSYFQFKLCAGERGVPGGTVCQCALRRVPSICLCPAAPA
jgi:hypothetical protein